MVLITFHPTGTSGDYTPNHAVTQWIAKIVMLRLSLADDVWRTTSGQSQENRDGISCAFLIWYWGRRDGGARYTHGVVKALADRPDTDVLLERFHSDRIPTNRFSSSFCRIFEPPNRIHVGCKCTKFLSSNRFRPADNRAGLAMPSRRHLSGAV